jgi:hypothetical protein
MQQIAVLHVSLQDKEFKNLQFQTAHNSSVDTKIQNLAS